MHATPTAPAGPRSVSRIAMLAIAIGGSLGGCRAARPVAIEQILADKPEKFGSVMERAPEFRVQVLLSEVVEDGAGRAHLRRSAYRAGAEYFYPASAIKLCGAVAAVQAMEELNRQRGAGAGEGAGRGAAVTLDSPLVYQPLFAGETVRDRDGTHLDGGTITLRHEIRKLFLVSDNEAFNRLYEFVGHRGLNESMHGLGLGSVVINHRLSVGRSAEENRMTPRIDIRTGGSTVTIPQRTSDLIVQNRDVPGLKVGSGYMTGEDQLKLEPMDFTTRNGISLVDLQDLLILLARPDIPLGKPRLEMTREDREFLLRTMREYPAESEDPRYAAKDFPDDWGKFLLPGLMRVGARGRDEITICNKVGQAYGFTIDNAYVRDQRTGRSFFLTAVIYTNADGILNDDVYEYDAVAFPFFADLGEAAARALWERTRSD